MSIVAEIPGLFQYLSDGSLIRAPNPTTAASPNFSNGYKTKDVVIDAAKPITARIFFPDTPDQSQPLPVLVYYHGGGFCFVSTKWTSYNDFLGQLCAKSKTLIVSVDYRLAPEHKLPAAYEDGYAALEWMVKNSRIEPWLERADLCRVFLSGESAGGNIVHHLMLRVVQSPIEGVKIKGLMIIHPFFGSVERVESELVEGVEMVTQLGDLLWKLSLPEGADRDHAACNFEKEVMGDEHFKKFPAVTVFVAGLDVLKERGVNYAKFLKKKGLEEVELVVAEGEQHAFHVWGPGSEATGVLQHQMAEFIEKH